jgi:zinc transport system ATP-binding protein
MSLVEIEGLAVAFGGRRVLSGVDMTVEPGEILTIVGPNGSGKSTLLRAIVGAVRPDAGQVRIAPKLRIGYVPQSLTIDPTLPMTVARFMNLPRTVARAEASAALDEVDAGDLVDRQMSALSGGQFQRVLLARALLGTPQLLILDEATRGLDQRGSAAFYRKVEDVRTSHGCAVLMVSHELHVVMAASDRVICLNGHVCCEGAPEAVVQADAYRALFGTGTGGALALYRHEHDHNHDHDHDPRHEHQDA